MSLLSSMKNQISKSGGSKNKILYIKADSKVRIRFLVDFEEGYEFTFHDSYAQGINTICQEELGKDCPLCDVDSLRTRKLYCWPVWNYDAKEVQLFLYAANNFTPVPAFIGMYETYGTVIDRDFVISRQGKEQNTSYSVIPMDKAVFRNKNAKVPSRTAILKLLDKAYPLDEELEFEEDEDEEEKPVRNKKGKKSSKKKPEPEEDFDDEDFEDEEDEEDEEINYEELSVKELYNLCKQRGIKAAPKKKALYYIDLLEGQDILEFEEEEDEDDEW